jgi:hypothetical protein
MVEMMDLNHRHFACDANALPTELIPEITISFLFFFSIFKELQLKCDCKYIIHIFNTQVNFKKNVKNFADLGKINTTENQKRHVFL